MIEKTEITVDEIKIVVEAYTLIGRMLYPYVGGIGEGPPSKDEWSKVMDKLNILATDKGADICEKCCDADMIEARLKCN